MAQHFLLSRAAKTLSLAQVFRLSIEEAELTFRKLRWADTNGAPVCPSCGSLDAYGCRRPSGVLRFRCKGCKKDFTVTSGTLFASHKLPLKSYLAAIAVFCAVRAALTASAGVAPNKFLAKLASDWRKPDGLFVIQPDDVDGFLLPLTVARLPGLGKVTEENLRS